MSNSLLVVVLSAYAAANYPGAPCIPATPGVAGAFSVPGRPALPGLPGVPGFGGIQGVPGMSGCPCLPGVPGMPGVAGVGGVPGVPGIAGTTGVPVYNCYPCQSVPYQQWAPPAFYTPPAVAPPIAMQHPGHEPRAAYAGTRVIEMTAQRRFAPARITITQGETIQWINTGTVIHTATADARLARSPNSVQLPPGVEPFNSGNVAPGGSYSRVFNIPGFYRYFCIPHEAEGMIGEIEVLPVR